MFNSAFFQNPIAIGTYVLRFEWSSEEIRNLFIEKFMFPLTLTSHKNNVLGSIFDVFEGVLPLAISVAGAILVVKLGWRLFRNFTKG